MTYVKILFFCLVSLSGLAQTIDQYKTTTAAGSVNAYTIPNSDFGAYRTNEKWLIDFTGVTTNSGAATLNRFSLGAKSIKMPDGSDVSSGILKGRVQLSYNGTYFYVVGGAGSSGGTVTDITFTSPLTGGIITTSGTVSIPAATSSVNGYLISTDWSTFNNKQAALVSGTNIKTVNSSSLLGSGNLAVGDALVANPLSQFASTTSAQLRGVLSDESGTAEALFGGATPSALTLTNATGLSANTGLSGTTLNSSIVTSSLTTVGTLASPTITSPVINGLPTGTGVSSSSTASTLVSRDANSNVLASNLLPGYTSTVTGAGTTTLTASSSQFLDFTGSAIQNVDLPVASTLSSTNIHRFVIENFSSASGGITVRTSGGNTIQVMIPNSLLFVKCVNPSGGTGTASWTWDYFPPNPMTTKGDIIYGETVVGGYAPPTRLGASTSGYVLTTNGPGTAPSWQAGGGLSGLTTNQLMYATSSTTIGGSTDLVYASRSLTVGLTSSGTNTLLLGNSGFTVNTSTGEFRSNAVSSHFHTWTYNNAEVMRTSGSTKNFLIGTTTDNSKLTVNGSFAGAYVAKTANYTLDATNYLVNCTANSFTITLPTAVSITGRMYIIKNTGAGTITLATTSSQTIDGSAPGTLGAGPTQISVMSDGANWITF